jgi:hypothetical protein
MAINVSEKQEMFYVLLTVHIGIILFNDQLDAQFFFFGKCLFQSSTCFEHSSVRHQEIQLCQYDIWYVTLCRWPSSMQFWTELSSVQNCIPDGHLHRVTYTKYHINWISWWWALECSKHVDSWNKHKQKKKNCASSWSFNRIIPRSAVNRT